MSAELSENTRIRALAAEGGLSKEIGNIETRIGCAMSIVELAARENPLTEEETRLLYGNGLLLVDRLSLDEVIEYYVDLSREIGEIRREPVDSMGTPLEIPGRNRRELVTQVIDICSRPEKLTANEMMAVYTLGMTLGIKLQEMEQVRSSFWKLSHPKRDNVQ